jgi:hypothetical protein
MAVYDLKTFTGFVEGERARSRKPLEDIKQRTLIAEQNEAKKELTMMQLEHQAEQAEKSRIAEQQNLNTQLKSMEERLSTEIQSRKDIQEIQQGHEFDMTQVKFDNQWLLTQEGQTFQEMLADKGYTHQWDMSGVEYTNKYNLMELANELEQDNLKIKNKADTDRLILGTTLQQILKTQDDSQKYQTKIKGALGAIPGMPEEYQSQGGSDMSNTILQSVDDDHKKIMEPLLKQYNTNQNKLAYYEDLIGAMGEIENVAKHYGQMEPTDINKDGKIDLHDWSALFDKTSKEGLMGTEEMSSYWAKNIPTNYGFKAGQVSKTQDTEVEKYLTSMTNKLTTNKSTTKNQIKSWLDEHENKDLILKEYDVTKSGQAVDKMLQNITLNIDPIQPPQAFYDDYLSNKSNVREIEFLRDAFSIEIGALLSLQDNYGYGVSGGASPNNTGGATGYNTPEIK